VSNILHCLNHGGLGGWLIDPNENLVQIYLPDQLPSSFEEVENELTMTGLASALTLTVGQVFGWLQVEKTK
jgi:Uma2 family endonuclease